MTFGQGQAQNFIIPMPQQQAAGGGGGGRPAGPAKEPDFDFKDYGLGDPQFDLQATDNVSEAVTQYYQDFANAKKFAKTMWKQHGIDVLAPSGDNQFSVIASNTFNKMIANLWDTYNKAKQGAAQLDKAAQAQMEGNGFINPQAMAQGRFFSQPDVSQRFTSTEVPEYIRVAKENISRTVDNQADFNRLMQDKRIVLDQAQRIYDANPTEQNRIALEAAKTMSPIRNYERTGGSGSGGGGAVAGILKETSKYLTGSPEAGFKPVPGRFDAQGYQITATDQRKGTVVGKVERVDPITGQITSVKDFVVDRSEFHPSLGKVVVYNEEGDSKILEKSPVLFGIETKAFTPALAYRALDNMGLDDSSDPRMFLSEQELAMLPNPQELGAQAPQVLAQREQQAKQVAEGTTGYRPTQNRGVLSTAWNAVLNAFLGPTDQDFVFKNPSGSEIPARRIERDGQKLIRIDGTDYSKLFGNSKFFSFDGKTYDATELTSKDKGVTPEFFNRLMEAKGYSIKGAGQAPVQGKVR